LSLKTDASKEKKIQNRSKDFDAKAVATDSPTLLSQIVIDRKKDVSTKAF
jgi:hypothetical protein